MVRNIKENLEEYKNEVKLLNIVNSKLEKIEHIALFGKDTKRIGVTAYQGIGRAFYEVGDTKHFDDVRKTVECILEKHYNMFEAIEKRNGFFVEKWFLYDVSYDEESNEIYLE